jgi:hypothetical protein
MILVKPKETGVIKIDLTGPDGNAFNLMGIARALGKAQGKDVDSIIARMRSGDYEHLLKVFDDEFGYFVVLYRSEEDI